MKMDSKMQRRDFLKLSAATAATPIVGEAQKKPGHFSAYDTVSIGKTGLRTSRLSFGTGIRSNNRHSMLLNKGRPYMVKLLRQAFDRGIRCFDLADSYGSHLPFADAIQGVPRDQYTIITKIWWRAGGIPEKDKAPVPQLIDRFLRELKNGPYRYCPASLRGQWNVAERSCQGNGSLGAGKEAGKDPGARHFHPCIQRPSQSAHSPLA